MNQTTSSLAGVLMLIAALLVYLTDLERAMRPFGYVFADVSALAGVGLLLLWRLVAEPKAIRYSRVILVGYALVTLLLMVVGYLSRTLDDGAGG